MNSVSYITYNDVYNGIYQSQVIDVVSYLDKEFELEIDLISFVPLRLWRSQKNIIKSHLPNARVYPILGSLPKWKRSRVFLKMLRKNNSAICRGPLAFAVANGLFKKVIYDGRAAVKSEVDEYDVTGNRELDSIFIEMERKAVSKSDYRIAVSSKLAEYWNENLNISVLSAQFVVIPCTLSSLNDKAANNDSFEKVRVVYSGGTGAWQSFEKVVDLFEEALKSQSNLEVIFLTKPNSAIESLEVKYPSRVSRKWVNHDEVYDVLLSCDYGILIRDKAVTNKVASPVKFAEYLNAGLKVLISAEIGDFSDFVMKHNCGLIIDNSLPILGKVNREEKEKSKHLCKINFSKDSEVIRKQYELLIKQL